MHQEQQEAEGGGVTGAGTEHTGDILSTEVTPAASLTSQQSDADDASLASTTVGEFTKCSWSTLHVCLLTWFFFA